VIVSSMAVPDGHRYGRQLHSRRLIAVAREAGWRRLRLTGQVGTKLNRSHLVHGEAPTDVGKARVSMEP
jgi:hypothetical protein